MTAPGDPVLPDYRGGWVGGIVPALVGGAPAPWLPEPVTGARAVVLLVLDGLGWTLLERNRAHLPTLAAMQGGPITTAVPSTTSAALTSITTGLTPAEHGICGYRIRVGGEILNVLRWRNDSGGAPEPRDVQAHEAFLGEQVSVVTRAEFRHSGFSKAHLRGARFIGWRTPSALVEHTRRLAEGGHSFTYAYYDGVDKVAHEFGLLDGFFHGELRAADRIVGDLLDVLPADTALLVTADHGQVQVSADGHRSLEALEPMVGAMGGEGRFRTLMARPGASVELVAAAQETFGGQAWVFARERLFDEGWLGHGGRAEVRGRVGDVVLAAREPVIFVDPTMPLEVQMRSHHGSLTADEVLVPLLAARGRA